MLELVVIYCLSAAPDQCVEKREPVEAPSTLLECNMHAQTTAIEYLRAHPRYVLHSWRCEKDHPRESPA